MKHAALSFLLFAPLSLLPACDSSTHDPAPEPGAGDALSGDASEADDSETPDADDPDGAGPGDATHCEPQCTDGVCSADGCGGECPACDDLPAPPFGSACAIGGAPAAPAPVTTTPLYPMVFNGAVHVTHIPGTDRLAIVERRGVIKSLPDQSNVTANDLGLVLDIQSRVASAGEEPGLLSVAFHPDFETNGHLFVFYTDDVDGKLHSVVSRFTLGDEGFGDPTSEVVLLSAAQPYNSNKGGQLLFGPDGLLYAGFGDGGATGDPYGHGQDTETLLGAIVRIDVDDPPEGEPYGIPADNPFAGGEGGRPEIWAWGFRNPWRFSFDPLTNLMWVGDIGEAGVQEINLVERGGNYGWNTTLGEECFKSTSGCDDAGLIAPVATYDPEVGQRITGGFVYRGQRFPNLFGAFIFADQLTGTLMAARFEDGSQAEITVLAETDLKIASFGQDAAGELLIVDRPLFEPEESRIHRLAPLGDEPAPAGFPLTLSETGCFADLATLAPAAGVLDYGVNVPGWFDGARALRHLSLPEGTTVTARTPEPWTLPNGARLIQTLVLNTGGGTSTRVETRFLVQEAGGARLYTYRWNEAQTDAVLLSSRAVWTVGEGDDARTWRTPGRHACKTCHNDAAGPALGWVTGQLNHLYDESWAGDQLHVFGTLGVIEGEVERVAWPSQLDEATVAAKARATLATDCASCHRPGGPTQSSLDLRFETALSETNACESALAPGQPDQSPLLQSMESLGPDRMPPWSTVVDPAAVSLVRDWISALEGCDEGAAD